MIGPGPFQFGIRRLVLLITASAAVLALCMRLPVPIPFRLTIACYFLLLTGWLIIRGPSVYRRLTLAVAQRRRIQQEREELMRTVLHELNQQARHRSRSDHNRRPGVFVRRLERPFD